MPIQGWDHDLDINAKSLYKGGSVIMESTVEQIRSNTGEELNQNGLIPILDFNNRQVSPGEEILRRHRLRQGRATAAAAVACLCAR